MQARRCKPVRTLVVGKVHLADILAGTRSRLHLSDLPTATRPRKLGLGKEKLVYDCSTVDERSSTV